MLVDHQGTPTQEFWEIIDSPSSDQYATLEDYCKAHQLDVPSLHFVVLQKKLEDTTFERLKLASLLEFFAMKKSGEWGNAGEYQVRLSMMGHILDLPADALPSFSDQEAFTKQIQSYHDEHKLQDVDAKDLHVLAKTFTFDFFGRSIPNQNVDEFNRLLSFLGSKNSIYISNFDNARRFIYGEAKKYNVSNHEILWFNKELCRSPHFIMAEAACSSDRKVMIRQASLETVFKQKWEPVLESGSGLYSQYTDDARQISEAIKRKALQALGVSSKETLNEKKEEFIKIMGETIIYHELGHVVVQNDILPKSIGPVAEGTKSLGYQVFLSLIELLADFAPSYNNLHGAIKHIYSVSKKSPQKATVMFYVYLSDVWFFDTQDEYMYLYSEFVMYAMMRYINPDQSINFEKINYDIHFDKRKKEDNKDTNRFVNFLFSILIKETRALKSLIHSSTYNLQNDTHTFVSVVQIVKVLFEKNKTNLKPDSYDYLTSLYSYIFMVAKQGMWPKDALSCQLNLSEKKVRTAFACLYDKSVSDAITPEKSRAVIYKKMTELGFTLN